MDSQATFSCGRAWQQVRWMAYLLLLCLTAPGCHSIPLGSIRSSTSNEVLPQGLGAPIEHIAASAEETPQVQAVAARGQAPDHTPAEQLIDLETAFQRAGVDNPTIALAEEAVRARQAERLHAGALLFPTLDAGMNW